MIDNISAVLIVKDAQDTLAECLESLAGFSEVVCFFNNTTDNSREIAAKFTNVLAEEGDFAGFGETRNIAAKHASNDWIFSIDSDEQLDCRSYASLQSWPLSKPKQIGVLLRRSVYQGRKMRGGLLAPKQKQRLYNRSHFQFVGAVHESLAGDAQLTPLLLDGVIWHDVCLSREKTIFYTDLEKQAGTRHRSFPVAVLGALLTFIRTYILQLGFIDGLPGLTSCYTAARYHLQKYHKP